MRLPYWQYFISLDTAFGETTRFVELSQRNYQTFSIEYVRIFLSTASEVDVVCKLLCNRIAPSKKANNIDDYRKLILDRYPKFATIKIGVPSLEKDIAPWADWNHQTNPEWWTQHNKVKHERGTYLEFANLKNSLNALCGLFAVLLYYYQPEAFDGRLQPEPSVLHYDGFPGRRVTRASMNLPDFP